MRLVDEETRRLIAMDRLNQLERDQAATAVDAIGAENDIWEPSDVSDDDGKVQKRKSVASTGRGRPALTSKGELLSTRGQRRSRKTVEIILMDEPALLPNADTFHSVMAPPASTQPGARSPWKLCSVCAHLSTYKCIRCGSNFCSIGCNKIHRDTKCLKFGDS